jgi:hypothetical protein
MMDLLIFHSSLKSYGGEASRLMAPRLRKLHCISLEIDINIPHDCSITGEICPGGDGSDRSCVVHLYSHERDLPSGIPSFLHYSGKLQF